MAQPVPRSKFDEQDAEAATNPGRAVLTGVPGVALEAQRPEVFVVCAFDLDGLPGRTVGGVVGEQPDLVDEPALGQFVESQPIVESHVVQSAIVEAHAVGRPWETGGVAIEGAARVGQVDDLDDAVVQECRRPGIAVSLPARRLAQGCAQRFKLVAGVRLGQAVDEVDRENPAVAAVGFGRGW
jgi:hypothetical protein